MKPLILVYTDDPMCSIDCADATCDVLKGSGLYDVQMIGKDSFPKLEFSESNLFKANCIVFPGGIGDADQFDNYLLFHKGMVQRYVANGGKYLGICQGSYFAGKHYFDLLTGFDSAQHIKRKQASTKRSGPSIVDIYWKQEKAQPIYFYDGAAFVYTWPDAKANVLGRYSNGDAAALIQSYEQGKVGVIGPHPEAQKWWFYSQRRIRDGWKNNMQHHMLLELVEELFAV